MQISARMISYILVRFLTIKFNDKYPPNSFTLCTLCHFYSQMQKFLNLSAGVCIRACATVICTCMPSHNSPLPLAVFSAWFFHGSMWLLLFILFFACLPLLLLLTQVPLCYFAFFVSSYFNIFAIFGCSRVARCSFCCCCCGCHMRVIDFPSMFRLSLNSTCVYRIFGQCFSYSA